MKTRYFITPILDRVDCWSWFPNSAAHGMFNDTAAANAVFVDFADGYLCIVITRINIIETSKLTRHETSKRRNIKKFYNHSKE